MRLSEERMTGVKEMTGFDLSKGTFCYSANSWYQIHFNRLSQIGAEKGGHGELNSKFHWRTCKVSHWLLSSTVKIK